MLKVPNVSKKTPGDFYMIHLLSYPEGWSVNDGICQEHLSVHYANIDKASGRINIVCEVLFLIWQKLIHNVLKVHSIIHKIIIF